MLIRASWNGVTLAESSKCIVVEGNYYFPIDALKMEYFRESSWRTHCHWKGMASYYHIEVKGNLNKNGAWYYPDPMAAATNIKGYVAFWNGVSVEPVTDSK